MSQARPFSVVREESEGTVAQLRGSSSGSGFAKLRAAYRRGSKFFSAWTEIGLAVMPTQASPLATSRRFSIAQPMFRSNRLEGLSISVTTLPLKRDALAGRRTRIRVVYGASAVRTTAGPASGQLYTLALPLTRYSSST